MATKRFTNAETGTLCASLAYLLHAGISNADALHLVADDEKRSSFKAVYKQMAEMADRGEYLSDVFRSANCYESYVADLLSVGEKTGHVEESLSSLAQSCDKRASLDRQMKSALVYPMILLLIMLLVVGVLLIKVLPIFNDVYSQLGTGLTGIAGGLLNFGQALGTISPVLIVLFVAAVVLLVLFASVDSFRDKVLGWFWSAGKENSVSEKISMSRFAQGLTMCLSSGLDLHEAIEMSANLPGNGKEISGKCKKCLELMNEDMSLASALKEAKLLPAAECRMLEAGLQGGSGDQAMEQISYRLTEDSDQAIANSIAKVEPTMVIITSLLVGLILLSVMLPLISIMESIG